MTEERVEVIVSPTTGMTFKRAAHPLTDDEIEERFGPMMRAALHEIEHDPELTTIIEMAESATRIARREARPTPTQLPAEIVQRIRSERASGRTWVQIAQRLNLDKIPTARGKRWNAKSVATAARCVEHTGGERVR